MAQPPTVYIHQHASFGGAFTPDLTRCRASVTEGGRSMRSHQCAKKATVHRDVIVDNSKVEGVQSVGFCSTHDPEKVAARRAKKNSEYEARRAMEERVRNWRTKRPDDYRDVLRLIAVGHGDSRQIATEALARWNDAEKSS